MQAIPQTNTSLGFQDPVQASQEVFRGVLKAMSRPGLLIPLTSLPASSNGLSTALAAIALTLCDYETPIWLDETLAAEAEVSGFLTFHTGAPICSQPDQATIALCSSANTMPPLEQFAQGASEYPDRSTTVVAMVESFVGGPKRSLKGPGIDGHIEIAPTSLPADFLERMAHNQALFPRGIDLILATEDSIIGLPRSVQIVE